MIPNGNQMAAMKQARARSKFLLTFHAEKPRELSAIEKAGHTKAAGMPKVTARLEKAKRDILALLRSHADIELFEETTLTLKDLKPIVEDHTNALHSEMVNSLLTRELVLPTSPTLTDEEKKKMKELTDFLLFYRAPDLTPAGQQKRTDAIMRYRVGGKPSHQQGMTNAIMGFKQSRDTNRGDPDRTDVLLNYKGSSGERAGMNDLTLALINWKPPGISELTGREDAGMTMVVQGFKPGSKKRRKMSSAMMTAIKGIERSDGEQAVLNQKPSQHSKAWGANQAEERTSVLLQSKNIADLHKSGKKAAGSQKLANFLLKELKPNQPER